MNRDEKISLLGHLDDLRRRLIYIAVAVVAGTIAAFYFRQEIFDALRSISGDETKLQVIGLTEGLVTAFKLSFTGGLILATPVLFYEVASYIRPALTPQERRYLYTLVPGVLLAFFGGAAFAFLVVLPPALSFLERFGSDFGVVEWRAVDYVSTIIGLLFGIGICFELPVLMYFLAKIRIIRTAQLRRFRRWAIVLSFILAAIITPTPDPINQTLVAAPLIILYEIGIILVWIAWRGKRTELSEQ